MSEHNMHVWDAVCRPDPKHLKPIGAGRLRGKSDINPQWRVKAMTETFGPCGVGWKWVIDRLWTENGADGEVMAFAQVSVYTHSEEAVGKHPECEGYWSSPIPGVGGSTLIAKEKNGLYNNDEAYKMAVTDALGTAMKMLGVAADIYLGNFDGSKYLTPSAEEEKQQKKEQKEKEDQQKKDRDNGLKILNVAADKGEDALKSAWQTLSEVMRVACQHDLAALKQKAKGVDARKDGNRATA